MSGRSGERAVYEGILLLDRQCPDWRGRIDTDTLDLASGPLCILGQLEGEFFDGARKVSGLETRGAIITWAQQHGFYANSATYPVLTSLWKRELTREVP